MDDPATEKARMAAEAARSARIIAALTDVPFTIHRAIDGAQVATLSADGYRNEVMLWTRTGRVDRPGQGAISQASQAFLAWIEANRDLLA